MQSDPIPWTRMERGPDGGLRAAAEPYTYMEVEPATVPPDELAAVAAALDEAHRELGFDWTVRVHWFAPHAGDAPVAFRVRPSGQFVVGRTLAGRHHCLWLGRGWGVDKLARSARHELAHIRWSLDHGLRPGHEFTPAEKALTEAWADAFADRTFGTSGNLTLGPDRRRMTALG